MPRHLAGAAVRMPDHASVTPNAVSGLSIDPKAREVGKSVLAGAVEVRSRVVKAVLSMLAIFLCLVPFAERVFTLIAEPVMAKMPADGGLIARQVASPFLTPVKATFWVSLFLSMPLVLYHIWRLLDQWVPNKRRHIAPGFIVASALLFYGGVAFAFFLLLPMVFAFFAAVTPEGVVVATDINAYLDFTIGIVLAFGLAFQVPLVIIVLVWTGLVSRATFAKSRPYVFLGAFVVGMLLTPPDVFSQTMLAIPMYLLFEAALWFCKRFLPERA
jgi:sec-independent protein translocase protein TatC